MNLGGRALRVVRMGPPGTGPLVVCEHGAFGCAADWSVVQERLAAKGVRSLAYDRAGLGYSDPGPSPRDGSAVAADLKAMLEALDEAGPYVIMGHSLGGLMARLFALVHPNQVRGLVLVDAMTPDMLDIPGGAPAVVGFGQLLRLASIGAQFGMMTPVSWVSASFIGLTGEAAAEKQRIHGSAAHARGAAEEVAWWRETSALAGARELAPALPVAVVTAGGPNAWNPLKGRQTAPASRSRFGYVDHVAGCNHSNLLGPEYADAIVRGVDHVVAAPGG